MPIERCDAVHEPQTSFDAAWTPSENENDDEPRRAFGDVGSVLSNASFHM